MLSHETLLQAARDYCGAQASSDQLETFVRMAEAAADAAAFDCLRTLTRKYYALSGAHPQQTTALTMDVGVSHTRS